MNPSHSHAWAGSLLAVLLSACAGAPAHAPPPAAVEAAASAVSSLPPLSPPAALGALAADDLADAMNERRASLAQALREPIAAGWASPPAGSDAGLRLTWQCSALFAPQAAQFQPQALLAVAELARWLRADGRVVLQLVAHESADDIDALGERRVAALAAFLIAEGALPERLRAQVYAAPLRPRADGEGSAVIDAVIVPVVAGREALAWTPPAETP